MLCIVAPFGVVGDGAGYLDACTGEGLTLAFRSAEAWVAAALEGAPERYPALHRRIMARYWIATSAVLALGRSPTLRNAAMRLFEAMPLTFRVGLAFATA